MKKFKLLSAICTMAIAASLTLTGCENSGAGSDAGRYDLYSMTEDGSTMTMEDLEEMYKSIDMEVPEMYIELKENGTGIMVMGEDDTKEIEWKDGVITADGEGITYTVKDGKLTMEQDGSVIVFEKAK